MYFASWTSIIYHTHALLLKLSEICAKMSEIKGSRSERVRLH